MLGFYADRQLGAKKQTNYGPLHVHKEGEGKNFHGGDC